MPCGHTGRHPGHTAAGTSSGKLKKSGPAAASGPDRNAHGNVAHAAPLSLSGWQDERKASSIAAGLAAVGSMCLVPGRHWRSHRRGNRRGYHQGVNHRKSAAQGSRSILRRAGNGPGVWPPCQAIHGRAVFEKDVELRPHTIDRYGRTVAMVFVDGRDANLQLVKAALNITCPRRVPRSKPSIPLRRPRHVFPDWVSGRTITHSPLGSFAGQSVSSEPACKHNRQTCSPIYDQISFS